MREESVILQLSAEQAIEAAGKKKNGPEIAF
jgi:hypothetical protein